MLGSVGNFGGTDDGATLYDWAQDLFPICRSLTGDGVRETLKYLGGLLPELEIHEISSGSKAMDWEVPDEWNIRDAHVSDLAGNRLIDFRVNNLHVVGYSEPVDLIVTRAELDQHLFSLPQIPNAIPYVTSYYKRFWGFCIEDAARQGLGDGPFRVVVDSTLKPGNLTYADLVIPGLVDDEILISTYICHPSMANNELSGPVVSSALARWLSEGENFFTYRFVFVPETIGSLVYLSKHLNHMKKHTRAGWVVTCIGDDNQYSYLPSRAGNTISDRISLRTVRELELDCKVYTFLDRGSDERQYCAPGVDLPIASLMRSKYGTYPEYHTSLDNLDFISPQGLQGGLDMMKHAVALMEMNHKWKVTTLGEPQMGARGLYPLIGTATSGLEVEDMMNVIAYCDGTRDLLEISDTCHLSMVDAYEIVKKLLSAQLLIPIIQGNE